MKTSELTGAALDWAVAKCENILNTHIINKPGKACIYGEINDIDFPYQPSTDWSQGGPIIEREGISVMENIPSMPEHIWEAKPSITAKCAGGRWGSGPTPLIAAMRCYVASKLGAEVEISKEVRNLCGEQE